MFAIFCRRRLRVPPNNSCISVAQHFCSPQDSVLLRSCSTGVCENASQKTFTVSSYLINSCGLSSNDAVSASKKLLCIQSSEKPDAVLKLLREYGFTDTHHIPRLIARWPNVLSASPKKTLLPKLDFFRSIGVPLPVLAQNVSSSPFVLTHSLENAIIPLYNDLKSLLGSDERVVLVFTRAPRVFGQCWAKGINLKISMLRERGVPESSIVKLVVRQPPLLALAKQKLSLYVDRAVAMGFDVSKSGFINAILVFASMTESTLKQKMDVYRKYGWTEPDIVAGFLKNLMCMALSEKKITAKMNFLVNKSGCQAAAIARFSTCMTLSEKKLMANMDFLVNKLGCEVAAIARCPALLTYSLEKRIKPRGLVAWILNEKGLKSLTGVTGLLVLSEEKFLNRYIVKYEKDVPELLDIYRGKLNPLEMGSK